MVPTGHTSPTHSSSLRLQIAVLYIFPMSKKLSLFELNGKSWPRSRPNSICKFLGMSVANAENRVFYCFSYELGTLGTLKFRKVALSNWKANPFTPSVAANWIMCLGSTT